MPLKLRDIYDICEKRDVELIKYLRDIKFFSSQQFCHKCKEKMSLVPKKKCLDGYFWQCRNGNCLPRFASRSLRKGTWFGYSRLTLQNIVLLTYMWVNQFTIAQVMYELGISSESMLTDWYNFFRDVCEAIVLQKSQPIGGPEKIVEMSEGNIQEKCKTEEQCFFGGVECGTDKCFLVEVPNCSKLTLLEVIKTNILPGTTVYSNFWNTYNCHTIQGFINLKIKASMKFISFETNNANKYTSVGQLKRKVSDKCQNEELFPNYLSEVLYRKTLQNVEDKFLTFIVDLASVYQSDKPDTRKNIASLNQDNEPDMKKETNMYQSDESACMIEAENAYL